jgi:NitT/TauT family transport system substrate-binding protein
MQELFSMHLRRTLCALVAVATAALAAPGCGAASVLQADSLGDTGKPVNLTVGYQPYYTEAWSGLVMRGKEFWRKYLPEGSTVEFQVGLQGSIIVSQLLAGKQQIGYVGDMPGIVGASKRAQRDLRIAATLGLSKDQCGVFLVRPDAPDFASQEDAIRWFGGKTVATPQGSCTDRIARATFEKLGVEPKEYLNQSIDVITSNFQGGKIDGAIIWEPTAAKLVNTGLAKRVASGAFADQLDAGFLVFDNELLDKRPDVADAWLKAELDAQRFLAGPANADEIVRIADDQTEGFSPQDLRDALYKSWPTAQGGPAEGVRLWLPYTVDDRSRQLITGASAFLHKINSIPSPQLPEGAVRAEVADKVLREAGASGGAGTIRAQG